MIISFDPCLFSLGFYKIQIYGLFALISSFLFFWLSGFQVTKEHLSNWHFHLVLFVEAALVGIASGRLFFVAQEYHYYFAHPLQIFALQDGGMSLVGGMIAVPCFFYLKLQPFGSQRWRYLDILAIYAPLFHAVSRLGCFLAGCCGGMATLGKCWSVVYTHANSWGPVDVPLVPLQLYSCLISLLVFAGLWLFDHKTKKGQMQGFLSFSYLSAELASRFVLDFWRHDHLNQIFLYKVGLSWYQVTVLLCLMASLTQLYLIVFGRAKKTT